MGFRLSEHKSIVLELSDGQIVQSKRFNQSSHCFIATKTETGLEVQANYCIGLDWIGTTGRSLYVEPKINSKTAKIFNALTDYEEGISRTDEDSNTIESNIRELDYLKMLLQITNVPESHSEIKDLVKIDWEAKPIEIEQKDDKLTPFLVVRYLQLLKSIVRKGLKKSYYKVQENLNNRVKGKILVGQHIKQNVFKNRFTNTYCEYQVFGEDHAENHFFKKVLQFASSYVENHKDIFGKNYQEIQHTINYCCPAFELISDQVNEYELKHIKHNPFYKDYVETLKIGSHILKKFAFNITHTTSQKVTTPPFWIDMPRLFELYIYSKMIEYNQTDKMEIHYQFSTYGNALDILVSKPNTQMVIDAKYKLHYQNGHLHEDIRQVAGYARLKKVREQLNVSDDKNIDCLIIYPDMENGISVLTLENIIQFRQEIKSYYKVFKLGVKLPWI
ncbi:5-methylcytosine-specific restriction endonuclease McrBC regulatory subunit McrC [Flavobacterium sp. HSC-32F16]|uniref:McrC family protein n=1 Tax=Flavobacterium sp. HSC-32F16 TaxID=2910964 RepID=UPI0020A4B395|nr:McrC family protein [Flavobacterium sp. HSC-32F16]MCP2027424.1 5-methylcytosine-specific restriction endonuclease McrBC regulatory subunit McrC [Flavobacterium sp. HSC-32F16]